MKMKLIILCAFFCNCCGQMILNPKRQSDKCVVDGNLFNELLSTKCALEMMTKEMNETKVQMEDKLQEANEKIEELQNKITEAESKHVQLSKNLEIITFKVEFLSRESECIESIGPVGRARGNPFSDGILHYYGTVPKILIWSGVIVYCISLTYGTVEGPCHGSTFDEAHRTHLQTGEYITGIRGQFDGHFQQVTIVTNQRSLGAYGFRTNGYSFSLTSDGKRLAYISGYADPVALQQLTAHFYC